MNVVLGVLFAGFTLGICSAAWRVFREEWERREERRIREACARAVEEAEEQLLLDICWRKRDDQALLLNLIAASGKRGEKLLELHEKTVARQTRLEKHVATQRDAPGTVNVHRDYLGRIVCVIGTL